ncbi:hypothetical protein IT570_04270 [Candidatus Sumerlaeota bacterium]|nr:hypothetical protein [Candidatus Sumerlaeota bacterium]
MLTLAGASFETFVIHGGWIPIVGIAIVIGAFFIKVFMRPKASSGSDDKEPQGLQETLFSDLPVEEAKRRVLELLAILEKRQGAPVAGELPIGFSSRLHPAYQDFLVLTRELSFEDEDDGNLRIGGRHVSGSTIRPGWMRIGNESTGCEIILLTHQLEVNTIRLKDGKEKLVGRHANLYHLLLDELEYLLHDRPDFPEIKKILYKDLDVAG